MENRISLITLGVRDMAATAEFYEVLGWTRVESEDGIVAFELIGQTLGLYPLEKLAEDIGLPLRGLAWCNVPFIWPQAQEKGTSVIVLR